MSEKKDKKKLREEDISHRTINAILIAIEEHDADIDIEKEKCPYCGHKLYRFMGSEEELLKASKIFENMKGRLTKLIDSKEVER